MNASACGHASRNASALTSLPCRDLSENPWSAPGKYCVKVAPAVRAYNTVCKVSKSALGTAASAPG